MKHGAHIVIRSFGIGSSAIQYKLNISSCSISSKRRKIKIHGDSGKHKGLPPLFCHRQTDGATCTHKHTYRYTTSLLFCPLPLLCASSFFFLFFCPPQEAALAIASSYQEQRPNDEEDQQLRQPITSSEVDEASSMIFQRAPATPSGQ